MASGKRFLRALGVPESSIDELREAGTEHVLPTLEATHDLRQLIA